MTKKMNQIQMKAQRSLQEGKAMRWDAAAEDVAAG